MVVFIGVGFEAEESGGGVVGGGRVEEEEEGGDGEGEDGNCGEFDEVDGGEPFGESEVLLVVVVVVGEVVGKFVFF